MQLIECIGGNCALLKYNLIITCKKDDLFNKTAVGYVLLNIKVMPDELVASLYGALVTPAW